MKEKNKVFFLHEKINFATIVNTLSVLKYFQLSKGYFILFVAGLQHLQTLRLVLILELSELKARPNCGHATLYVHLTWKFQGPIVPYDL